MKQFDPDKPFVKKRGMGQIHYEQDGHKFDADHRYVGKLESEPEKPEPKKDSKEDVRARARAKINKKRKKPEDDPLDGFRPSEAPEAVSGARKEDAAARAAEEHAE